MYILFITIPKLAYIFSENSFFKTVLLIISLQYFVITRKLGIVTADFPLTYSYCGFKNTLYLRKIIDIAVLKEVYLNKEYEWFPIENPKVIIDLGAHFGDTALYYHAHFPDTTIIAVEPSPESFERLKKNVAHISNIKPIQVAMGSKDGEIQFNLAKSSFGDSVVLRENTTTTILVPCMTLDTLFAKFSIVKADMIKFDIEGGEFDLFAQCKPSKYADTYIGELHFDLSDVDIDTFKHYFSDFTSETKGIQPERFLFTAQ